MPLDGVTGEVTSASTAPGRRSSRCFDYAGKYGTFPEYHTSLDDLDNLVTPEGLAGGFEANRLALEILERNVTPVTNVIGEPFMSKRNLRPTLGGDNHNTGDFKLISDLISMSDGSRSLLDIAEFLDVPAWELYAPLDKLIDTGLISSAQRNFELNVPLPRSSARLRTDKRQAFTGADDCELVFLVNG